jgi:hypothetical protein
MTAIFPIESFRLVLVVVLVGAPVGGAPLPGMAGIGGIIVPATSAPPARH